MPSAHESHPDMKAESYPTWAPNDLSLRATSLLCGLPFPCSLLSSSIHPSAAAPFRGREQTTCFGEESLTGSIPDQSTSSSPAPLASLSSTLSLRTGLDDLRWIAALCLEQDGCKWEKDGERGVIEEWCHLRSLLEVGLDLWRQEWCCLWASVQGKADGDGMMWKKSVRNLVCV